MQRTTWVIWDPSDMQDAADFEGHASLDFLAPAGMERVETLPYHGALSDLAVHTSDCPACMDDSRPDCPEGVLLLEVSRVGVSEQHSMAAFN